MNETKKANIRLLLSKLDQDELNQTMGYARQAMLNLSKVTSTTHFVCPITDKVLRIKGSKKIITELKYTRYCKTIGWYYMSRKAFNKIQKQDLYKNVKTKTK